MLVFPREFLTGHSTVNSQKYMIRAPNKLAFLRQKKIIPTRMPKQSACSAAPHRIALVKRTTWGHRRRTIALGQEHFENTACLGLQTVTGIAYL